MGVAVIAILGLPEKGPDSGLFATSVTIIPFGEMDERFKSHAWKACVGS